MSPADPPGVPTSPPPTQQQGLTRSPAGRKQTAPLQKPLPHALEPAVQAGTGKGQKAPNFTSVHIPSYPWSLLQRLTPNKVPGAGGCLPTQDVLEAVGRGMSARFPLSGDHVGVEAHAVAMKPQSCSNAAGNSPLTEVATCLTYTPGAPTHLPPHADQPARLQSQLCSRASVPNCPSVPKPQHAAKAQGSPWTPA